MQEELSVKKIEVDFSKCRYIGELYLELKQKLELPDWCGENLDALWDALTGIMYTPAEISIKKTTAWKEIQEHANSIVDTMHEAETLYHEISVTVVD